MAFQQIKEQLDKTHTWYIILTGPCAELKTKARLEDIGMITYLPLASVKRQWGGKTKRIRIPAIARCVFIYASDEELQILQNGFSVFRVKELFNTYQNQ
ncbi:UpxY family transcription antiterminator [Bacteroides sp.]|uniref:UpxY family transcription antiterminator n=1 Tax=Bacteroides sp. TaxID=29523 RepID=UPI002638E83B|nr:UpxY family transcription antiterminator [Bacteroides sp.]